MILEYKKGSKKYRFSTENINPDDNVFTVIVGKNGTGKSRLLGEIIRYYIDDNQSINYYNQSELGFSESSIGEVVATSVPNKIIAVSTSPFDKFPIRNRFRTREEHDDYYSYVGLRDLRTHNFGLAFISQIFGSLLNVVSNNKNQFYRISEVLNYLGYTDEIFGLFEFKFSRQTFEQLLESENSLYNFEEIFERKVSPNSRFFRNENNEIDPSKVNSLINILKKRNDWRKHKYEIFISNRGIESEFDHNDLAFLIDSGIIRLRDVRLRKLESKKIFRINEASSGEQCVFTTFLGLACQIEDNCVIFIDEPEISLHPEWQEKYITLLISTFKNFKRCHFIIATHSPQLISKLQEQNCFVLKMDNREIKEANEFINQSIDYQLANVFNSPGFKNEYLSRLIFSIMSKVAKSKKLDKDDLKNFQIINSQLEFMDENDPLIRLFELIKELKEKYA
jgi:predicted ATP-binding protein involved in virulence